MKLDFFFVSKIKSCKFIKNTNIISPLKYYMEFEL